MRKDPAATAITRMARSGAARHDWARAAGWPIGSDDAEVIEWSSRAMSVPVLDRGDRAPSQAEVHCGAVRPERPGGLPLVDVVTDGDGHVLASDRLPQSTAGTALRYRSHTSSKDDLAIERGDEAGRPRATPVVFNAYMNTFNGDPTTERLLPLIEAAAVGAEVICIDAGWYADGFWWDSVGEWPPCEQRFPGRLGLVVHRIREIGMVPGLRPEPEVIGVNSLTAASLPDEAFLQRHGQRVVEHERYHLDLRHPAAVAHRDDVVDRLVTHCGVGFFELDYNVGPDHDGDSVGDGPLQRNRAHPTRLDGLFERHPDLVIENCECGAMRLNFAMLFRMQMQSTSDRQDFLRYPPIAASATMQMLPEQAISWAYSQPEMSEEEVAFSLVTGLLGRFYLSGYVNRTTGDLQATVAYAIQVAKLLRPAIAAATPSWTLGLPGWEDDGLGDELLVPTCDRTGDADIRLAIPDLTGAPVEVAAIFPSSLPSWTTAWDSGSGTLRVRNPTSQVGARLFRIQSSHGA